MPFWGKWVKLEKNKHGAQVKMRQILLHLARKIGQMIGWA
jgi:hypothetical protein